MMSIAPDAPCTPHGGAQQLLLMLFLRPETTHSMALLLGAQVDKSGRQQQYLRLQSIRPQSAARNGRNGTKFHLQPQAVD